MQSFKRFFEDRGAVSPVVGVVLMVAVTAILAGIVGIYTVDMTETKLSNSTDQMFPTLHVSLNLSADDVDATTHLGTVNIEHLGGDPLDFDTPTTEIVVYEGGEEATVTHNIGELSVGHRNSFDVSDIGSGDEITIKIIDVVTQRVLCESIVVFP